MIRDIIIRAIKTFVQAALGCLAAALAGGIDITDKSAVIGLLISAVAAGASAVWNFALAATGGGSIE